MVQYLQVHLQHLKQLQTHAQKLIDQQLLLEENIESIKVAIDALCTDESYDEQFYQMGQDTLCRIVAAWPQLTPHIARDLLWFFGGSCLQFMPEHEIAIYQQLEEARFSAESSAEKFDFTLERNKLFGLH